jgi:hypothetical protein
MTSPLNKINCSNGSNTRIMVLIMIVN